jgi:hypothetical protein
MINILSFLNFGNLSFIVSLGIILLLTSMIMLYVRTKFASYDKCLEEQSNLLKKLVISLQTPNIVGGNFINNDSKLASNVAINTARQININNKSDKKIIVSDDEDDEYTNDSDDDEIESDSESDSETQSESESESETETLSETHHHYDNILISKKIDNNYDDDIETIETNNINNKKNLVGGGICYLELLSVINDTNLNENLSFNDTDLNQCIKIISIKSNEDDYNMNVLELNDNLLTNINNTVEETILNSNNEDNNLNKLNLDDMSNISEVDIELHAYTLDDIKDMKKNKLQDLCKRKNISTNGTRNELITRLSTFL